MTLKLTLAALALIAPQIAFAECSSGHKPISASSCGAGEVWDALQMQCVTKPSS